MDKIICLGKNYAAHTAEMKEAQPEKPVLFLKPPSCYVEVKNNGAVRLPWERGLIHHECEVVLKLYKKNVIAIALGLDLTLRDLQKELKSKGHPWEIAKCFTNSAIVTPFVAQRDFPDWRTAEFTLKVNGEVRQQGSLSQCIFSPDQAIHHAVDHFPMRDGDIIFTGTPEGVGPLKALDEVEMLWGPINVKFRLLDEQ